MSFDLAAIATCVDVPPVMVSAFCANFGLRAMKRRTEEDRLKPSQKYLKFLRGKL